MGAEFTVPIAPSQQFEPAQSTYYWYPGRFGVKKAPASFLARLHELHPDLDCTWHPVLERWLIWYRKPKARYKYCPGWILLLIVQNSAEEYIPLDERVLAAVYAQSAMRWGSGRRYFDRVEAEHQRAQEQRKKTHDDDRDWRMGDLWQYHQIKNIGNGSKFTTYHS